MDIIHAEKYYKQVQERFPYLSLKQIEKIIQHGLRRFFFINKHGGDVLLKSNYYTSYVGRLFFRTDAFWKYWTIKWAVKVRIKYCMNRTPFNGKYYFILTEDQYKKYIKSQQKTRGRRRTRYTFDELKIYKLFDECAIHKGDYIFELDYPTDIGFCKKFTNWTISKFRLVSKRDLNTNNFIPVSENEKRNNKHCVRRS